LLGVLVAAAVALMGAGLWVVTEAGSGLDAVEAQLFVYGAIGVFGLCVLFALVWASLHVRLIRPLAALTREIQTLTHARAGGGIDVPDSHILGALPDALSALACQIASERQDIHQTVSSATASIEEHKSRLEAILLDLSEGVIVCSLEHRILLYNQSAARILNAPEELGLGRNLFGVLTREPVVHTLEQMAERLTQDNNRRSDNATMSFVCGAINSQSLLRGCMSLVLDADHAATGYVLTITDVSKELAELAKRDSLLRTVTEKWRTPFASLRAASEALAAHPDMDPEQRAAFDEVITKEAQSLSNSLDSLAQDYRRLSAGQWPMADIFSVDLLGCVTRKLREAAGIEVTMIGMPLWLHGDSHSLTLALQYLIERVHRHSGISQFDVECLLADRNVYLEASWKGSPVPSQVLDSWLDDPLHGAIGGHSVREIVEHHDSELWSGELRAGHAYLRMPLAAPTRLQFQKQHEDMPSRPEFYDFDLLVGAAPDSELAQIPLRQLGYVVFDTETTGLKPSAGDEIISVAGVRIVNGRILSGETFDRLINPGRGIPKKSIRFHGITDEMVRDKPPIHVVLPQFKSFIGEAVLVAHNAAFDMKFIKLKETECDLSFDNPVLDTLLLSAYLHDQSPDHTLDAVAKRFAVEIKDRHSGSVLSMCFEVD
jgi:DNA polymerase-3 subunit epsilon